MKTYEDYGIDVSMSATGEQYSTCPKCSISRKKKNIKCLGVDTERQIWNCNHCNWSGSLKSGILTGSNKNYLKSEKYLKPNWKKNPDPLPEKVIKWFSQRGITKEILVRNDIRYGKIYMPQVEDFENAIQFPYKRNGEVVNVKYRDGKKNFRQVANAEKILYKIDDVVDDFVIISEGETDALSFEVAGYKQAVSVPDGAPSLKSKNFDRKFEYLQNCKKFDKCKSVLIAVDSDEPGKILENELARRIGKEKCSRVIYPEGCKDANEVLVKYGVNGVKKLVGTAKPFPIAGIHSISDISKDIQTLYVEGYKKPLSTGWKGVDEYYRVRGGEFTVVTGIPGHGKSEFLDALIVNMMTIHGWSFGICSPENLPHERHFAKLAEKVIKKPFNEGKTPRMSEKELVKAETILNDKIEFIMPDLNSMTIDTVLKIAKSLIYRKGIKGLMIDPWNEFDHSREKGLTETEYVSMCLSKIRRFARDNDIHIWIVAHPTKLQKDLKGKYPVPTTYDISGSANWRNKSDNALSIFRHVKDNLVEIHIQKIRWKEVGKMGMATLNYDFINGCYSDINDDMTSEVPF